MWMVGYHHFNFFPIQIFYIKIVFSLVLNKIDFGVSKFKNLLLEPKLNLLN
jgi:hypothetical protein